MSKMLASPGETSTYARAHAQGYSDGVATARRREAADALLAAEVRERLIEGIQEQANSDAQRVKAALAAVDASSLPQSANTADLVLAAAFEIAQSIIQVALNDEQKRALSIAARAGAAEGRSLLKLLVHPSDVNALSPMFVHCDVVSDATLSPGDFKAQYATGWVDGVLSSAISRVRAETERQINAL